jgi:hypothetical protein
MHTFKFTSPCERSSPQFAPQVLCNRKETSTSKTASSNRVKRAAHRKYSDLWLEAVAGVVTRVEYVGDGSYAIGVAKYDAGDAGGASVVRLLSLAGSPGDDTTLRLVITCRAYRST